MENPHLNKTLQNNSGLAKKFEEALNLTIEKYISSMKYSLFKKKYHGIYENAGPSLRRIHQQLQEYLKSEMKINAVALYAELDVSYLLHSFEKIMNWIQESNLDEARWFVESQQSVPLIQLPCGCSSLNGFPTQLGPLQVSAEGKSLCNNPTKGQQTLSVSKDQKRVKKDCRLSKVEYRDKLKQYLQKLSLENEATENIMYQNHKEIVDLKESIINLNQVVCKSLDDLKEYYISKTEEISFETKSKDSGVIT